MNRLLAALYPAAFVAGLAAIAWAAFSALQQHRLALAMIGLIAAFFLLAAWELRRFRQHSQLLAGALDRLAPAATGDWLQALPAALRELVQRRLEGERASLPGLSLAPALTGLLVLLGMLGTFLGLVVTLGGTAAALRAGTELAALQAALTAPVQGLGLAFGCSVAGVAASAMLGLMLALARRERSAAVQRLEQALATLLRPHTAADRPRQRQQQARAEALPALVAQMQALATALSAQQAGFHAETRAVYTALAASVEASLRSSLLDSARQAGATIQPLVESTMAGIAREAGALHERVAGTVAAQLQQLALRLDDSVARQAAAGETLAQDLHQTLAATRQAFGDGARELQQQLGGQAAAQLQALASRFEAGAAQLGSDWQAALGAQARAAAEQAEAARQAQQAQADGFAQQTTALLAQWAEQQSRQQAAAAALDNERLAQWRDGLAASAATLQQGWAQASAASLGEQQRLAEAMAQTARELIAQAEAQSRGTLAEVGALLQAAAETPRAAAEMVQALREQLSRSLAQDQAMLTERGELMQGLQALLTSARQAAGEQREAIAALQLAAAQQIDAVSRRYAEQTEGSQAAIAEAVLQLSASAAEMGSLGEGFAAAVERFHGGSEHLVAHLAQLETALASSSARSDEQLGYYVAQARELIDLCLMAQKQALDALQRAPQAAELAHG